VNRQRKPVMAALGLIRRRPWPWGEDDRKGRRLHVAGLARPCLGTPSASLGQSLGVLGNLGGLCLGASHTLPNGNSGKRAAS
jgi:hypothetical protein